MLPLLQVTGVLPLLPLLYGNNCSYFSTSTTIFSLYSLIVQAYSLREGSLSQSLADFLGAMPTPSAHEPGERFVDLAACSPKQFCKQILESVEFRQYLLNSITLGSIPPAVVLRLMDVAWGKPTERLEVTDTTNRFEGADPAALEARAMELATLARQLRERERPPLDADDVEDQTRH